MELHSYRVAGIDRESGLDTSLVLQAESRQDAELKGANRGIVVERVRPVHRDASQARKSKRPVIAVGAVFIALCAAIGAGAFTWGPSSDVTAWFGPTATYEGKEVDYWTAQLHDLSPKTRSHAIEALMFLADKEPQAAQIIYHQMMTDTIVGPIYQAAISLRRLDKHRHDANLALLSLVAQNAMVYSTVQQFEDSRPLDMNFLFVELGDPDYGSAAATVLAKMKDGVSLNDKIRSYKPRNELDRILIRQVAAAHNISI